MRRLDDLAQGGAPLAGTPTFMAPELFRGTPASPQSDIYALGVMLFHTLSGRLPFIGDNIHQDHSITPASTRSGHQRDGRGAGCPRRDPEAMPGEVARRTVWQRPGSSPIHSSSCLHGLRDTESLVRESAKGLDCFIQGRVTLFASSFPSRATGCRKSSSK